MEALKWKPPSHNSVDYKLMIARESRAGMLNSQIGLLFVGGHQKEFSTMKVTRGLKEHDKKIIECTWDFEKNEWKFMRVRTDKSFPNAFATACGVWESIRNPIYKDDLIGFIENYGWKPSGQPLKRPHTDNVIMPPPKMPRPN
jgi:mRNA-capping enzyme